LGGLLQSKGQADKAGPADSARETASAIGAAKPNPEAPGAGGLQGILATVSVKKDIKPRSGLTADNK